MAIHFSIKSISRVAQRKRVGLITQRSVDRNHSLLFSLVKLKNFRFFCKFKQNLNVNVTKFFQLTFVLISQLLHLNLFLYTRINCTTKTNAKKTTKYTKIRFCFFYFSFLLCRYKMVLLILYCVN